MSRRRSTYIHRPLLRYGYVTLTICVAAALFWAALGIAAVRALAS